MRWTLPTWSPRRSRTGATPRSWHHLPSKVWLLKTVHMERLEPYGQNRVTYRFEDQGSGVKLVLKLGAHGDEVGLSQTYSGFLRHGCLARHLQGPLGHALGVHCLRLPYPGHPPGKGGAGHHLLGTARGGLERSRGVPYVLHCGAHSPGRAKGLELMDTGASNIGLDKGSPGS